MSARTRKARASSSATTCTPATASTPGDPMCLDFKTGKVMWKADKEPGTGVAGMTSAEGKLIFRSESNLVSLVAADPTGYHLISTFTPECGKPDVRASGGLARPALHSQGRPAAGVRHSEEGILTPLSGRDAMNGFMSLAVLAAVLGTGAVLAAEKPAATTTAGQYDDAALRAKYPIEVRLDVSETPDMKEWAEKAKQLVEEWYPRLADYLASDGFTPPKKHQPGFQEEQGGDCRHQRRHDHLQRRLVQGPPEGFRGGRSRVDPRHSVLPRRQPVVAGRGTRRLLPVLHLRARHPQAALQSRPHQVHRQLPDDGRVPGVGRQDIRCGPRQEVERRLPQAAIQAGPLQGGHGQGPRHAFRGVQEEPGEEVTAKRLHPQIPQIAEINRGDRESKEATQEKRSLLFLLSQSRFFFYLRHLRNLRTVLLATLMPTALALAPGPFWRIDDHTFTPSEKIPRT